MKAFWVLAGSALIDVSLLCSAAQFGLSFCGTGNWIERLAWSVCAAACLIVSKEYFYACKNARRIQIEAYAEEIRRIRATTAELRQLNNELNAAHIELCKESGRIPPNRARLEELKATMRRCFDEAHRIERSIGGAR